MSCPAVHELRNKRKKKQSSLRIEHFCHDALPKGISRAWETRDGYGVVFSRVQNHAYPQEAEVRCAKVFHSGERDRGPRKNNGDSCGGGKNMYHPAEEGAEGRKQAFAASARESAGEDVEHAWAGSDGQQKCCGQENEKP